MPEHQNPDHLIDSIKVTRPTHLQLPVQPVDRPRSTHRPLSLRSALCPSPDPPHGRRKKRSKSVRWDPSVIDNEHKMKFKAIKASSFVRPSKSSGSSAKPSGQPASSRSPKANTPVKIDPSATRQQPDYTYIQSRRPASPTLTEHSCAPPHYHVGANSASKMVPNERVKSPTKMKKAPPAVPDPPRAYRPPPAPRPARLPTPDLPEIDESKFFVPKDKLFDFSRGRDDPRGRSATQKTDTQLDSAIAYIQERKRRGY